MNNSLNHILEKIKQEGHKLTSPRESIAALLSTHAERHFTVEELYDLVNAEYSSIGLATVYRTVNLFCDIGILTKLDFSDGYDRYELVEDSHHHHHLICDSCGEISEVREDFLEELEEKIKKTYGFHVTGHVAKFYGLCSTCLNKKREKNE